MRPRSARRSDVHPVVPRTRAVLRVAQGRERRVEPERVDPRRGPRGEVDDRLRAEARHGGAADVLDREERGPAAARIRAASARDATAHAGRCSSRRIIAATLPRPSRVPLGSTTVPSPSPSLSSRRALVLGGTGAIGGATAERLGRDGWSVDVTGRDTVAMPAALADLGVRFHAVDRSDARAIERLVGDGVDLLVDLVAFTAADVEALLPAMRASGSVVVASSRAVYVDDAGRHVNGDEPPRFPVPIPEENATLAPAADGTDPFTRKGYAPSKVAVERAALDSGLPVTVIRPSKVHGRWARNARTRAIVERMLAGAPTIELADRGASVDHLTAAANAAALIARAAEVPGARILNSADPDPLPAAGIVAVIADELAWRGRIVPLEPGVDGGAHPWAAAHPIVLDTRASLALGYAPVGPGAELLRAEVAWIRDGERPRG
ncbi:nucleoside-diphosphate sugar epimerase [Clavibacter michiganensis subsp. insidiosus]|nr:nucleoside-diphosphate sugar epimerase [Clavibacter michiganensis subsp. insidiosus]AWG00343.1 nucleoside-diphosphate sugar epimerase [Clavibacter michiganensis subsp. insidiosus]